MSGNTMPEDKVTTIRLSDEDLEAITLIQRETGITSQSDAVRYALRMYLKQSKPKRPVGTVRTRSR